MEASVGTNLCKHWRSQFGEARLPGKFANNASEKEGLFTPKIGKLVPRTFTEVNGKPWTSMAELSIIGSPSTPGNQAPNWFD